jgi:microcystin-dependent protein
MALPSQSQQALIWQAYGADATNLVAPILCDFTSYSAYTFNPSGIFRQTGNVFATGVVIDNLLSASPVTVAIGPINETVPPYTKTTLTLAGTSAQVTIAGTQSRIYVTFFRGSYMGTTSGTNFYAAQLAAGLAVETGFVSMFAGSTASIPTGYLLCDGTAISRTDYAGLFSKIGTLYGPGDGSTTFNLPDFTSRVPIGAGTGAGLATRGLASKGGAEQVILTATQMPVHTHAITDPGHAHGVTDPGHAHATDDPGHAHGTSDPGHTHGTSDPGHVHNFLFKKLSDGSVAGNISYVITDAGGAANTWPSQSTGNWFFNGRPNFTDNAEPYTMQLTASTTGIGITKSNVNVAINGSVTGVVIKSAATGVSVQSGTTGITMASAGGSAGVTQPTPTVPPYTALNFVIKT